MRWPQLLDYGCLMRWPQNGESFIHPDDVSAAKACFGGQCVFRRDTFNGVYYHCVYGELQFRIKPCLWLPVQADGIDMGDWVETTGVGMSRELFVGTVQAMEYAKNKNCILYRLRRGEMMFHARYVASQLRQLDSKKKIRPRESFRLEPQADGSEYRLQQEI